MLILIAEEEDQDFHKFSIEELSGAYADNEPEYELSLVKEPDTLYVGR